MRSYVSGYVCPVSCRSCYSLTAKIFWFLSQESPRLARSSSSSVNNPQSLWLPLLSSLSGLPINSEAEDLTCSPNSKFLYSSSPYPSLDYGTFFQFYFWNLNVPSLKHPIFNSYIKHPFILRIILTVDSLEIYFWISFLCTIHCFCVSPISAWNPHSGAEALLGYLTLWLFLNSRMSGELRSCTLSVKKWLQSETMRLGQQLRTSKIYCKSREW